VAWRQGPETNCRKFIGPIVDWPGLSLPVVQFAQDVSLAPYGGNHTIGSGGIQLSTQFADEDIDDLRFGLFHPIIKMVHKRIFCDCLIFSQEQQLQDRVLSVGELHRSAADADLTRVDRKRKSTRLKKRLAMTFMAPDNRFNAGSQFVMVNWPGDTVVGTEPEGSDPIVRTVSCESDEGRIILRQPKTPNKRKTFLAERRGIDDHEIKGLVSQNRQALISVVGLDDERTVIMNPRSVSGGLSFYDKEAHLFPPRPTVVFYRDVLKRKLLIRLLFGSLWLLIPITKFKISSTSRERLKLHESLFSVLTVC
jgi:hypothetical protein